MAAQHDIVGERNVVPHLAIMRHVRPNHEEAFFAHFGYTASLFRSGIHCHAFTDIAVRANNKPRPTTAIFNRLRWRSERRKWINHRTRTNLRMTAQMNVRDQPASVPDRHMRPDYTKGADRNILSDRGSGFDPRRGIDHACAHASASRAPTRASATSSPPTFASPRYHHMFLRRVIFSMWYSIWSPGRTGLRNLAPSIVRKNTDVGWTPVAAMQSKPAVCAMPSINSTPGKTGLPGK